MPVAKNGNDRGFCNWESNHLGRHGNGTCPGCGIKLTKHNTSPSVMHQGRGLCSRCGTERPRERLGYAPRNYQVSGSLHTFPCGCSGILPEQGECNQFVATMSDSFLCRVSSILGQSQRGAKKHGHKPIPADTPHLVIRQMMQEKNCVLCGKLLKWEFGPGKTPHLHHNHDTGNIIGFSCPRCNPLDLQRRVVQLESEVRQLKESQSAKAA